MRNLISLVITGLVERIEWLHRCRRHDIGTKFGKIARIRRGHRSAAPKLSQAKLGRQRHYHPHSTSVFGDILPYFL